MNLRAVLRLAALAVALVVALPLHGLWCLVRAPSPWPRRFLGMVARLLGARAQVTGTPLTRHVVILSNHLSWLDILLLAGATGTTFVAKDDLAQVPLVGWLCRLNGTIFVRREERMGVERQVAVLRDALARPQPVTIFPEGTTGDGTALLPFKGTLLAALDRAPPGLMVQPARIDYGAATAELAWVNNEPGVHHARRVLRRRGGFVAHLRFLEPFVPARGRKAIAAEARARIAAALPPCGLAMDGADHR